jgi:hypothetical protein
LLPGLDAASALSSAARFVAAVLDRFPEANR